MYFESTIYPQENNVIRKILKINLKFSIHKTNKFDFIFLQTASMIVIIFVSKIRRYIDLSAVKKILNKGQEVWVLNLQDKNSRTVVFMIFMTLKLKKIPKPEYRLKS